jgi:hypothetical protein
MSNITGADLDQLDQLAAAFTTAGTEISARAAALQSKIHTAVSNFEHTLSTMQSETTTLASQMNDEMAAIRGHAAGVSWSGNNRAAFDGDLSSFSGVVQRGTSQIASDISSITGQVDSRFTPVLTEFASALRASADDVGSATTTMKTAVDTQRSNLDQAANVGWTSA